MKSLTVLYDGECGLCQNLRAWLQQEPTWFPVEYLPLQSPLIKQRWPDLHQRNLEKQLTAIDDQGGLYQGSSAWITLLYALRKYRGISFLLATPTLQSLARKVVEEISKNRHALSDLLALKSGNVDSLLQAKASAPNQASFPTHRADLREELLK
jgi:predicted DCC family thiol-disulfide oxidoreductase YuxK